MSSLVLDELDRAIVHALHIDGRAPFSHIASVLDVSDQTVARRYRRIRSAGSLRVIGLPNARRLGWVEWFVRVQVTPDAAVPVAEALARRTDTSWVCLTSGGTQICCVTRARSSHERDALLLGQLPRTPRVTSVMAHCLLRVFAGGPSGWHGRADTLTPEQAAALAPEPPHEQQERVVLQEGDEQLLASLARDGRTTYSDIAKATGWSEMTAKRRLAQLRRRGALFFDVDIDPLLLGFETLAILWLTVDPAQMRPTAEAIAAHPEVAFAAATTGPTNLLVIAACHDVDALYDFLERGIGNLPGIRQLESAPIIRNSKRVGTTQTPGS
ncbi:Lrp/AsnC family transcriptional regulator [Amycolatopsis regifaucium]|uniref:AsnC family protein n=1 Tax=Amycolatopsis regifaucium TaxID=546365 RepID=A0A154MKF6_9PSEU|nr:Lrp/AsnC family transcriptional regulator [Amycolatopsis regifaucium]KZB84786.1 AsnC family transcriptional regulator [Amycolatopsis regifaucium]OKA05232.1 AsnC family protein [Amycolatopsis regifaucium]SFJ64033.1 DNA-binding transcriptional regulator, Lrp family [Amycolatopsis regifaucium]